MSRLPSLLAVWACSCGNGLCYGGGLAMDCSLIFVTNVHAVVVGNSMWSENRFMVYVILFFVRCSVLVSMPWA